MSDGRGGGEAPDVYAGRAARAYAAMQRRFRRSDGLYRRDGRLRWPGAPAHLWPLARAIVATLDLAGLPEGSRQGLDAGREIADHLNGLERYWDERGDYAAYSSDVLGARFGGDRYYDDNAWVGLALVQLERMRPGSDRLDRAADLFRFAWAGWDRRADVSSPGGVFWVEQGRGEGKGNHDRNTVSNAPNAELGLHLAELLDAPAGAQVEGARAMYEWVNATLDAGDDPDHPGTGLFWDKLSSDGTVDKAVWSYNQGSMVGANVLLARRDGTQQALYLDRAERIARQALRHFGVRGYETQPPAFNAIYFRNLLLLHAATGDGDLRGEILGTMRGYVDRAWSERRDRDDLFQLSPGGVTLLNQSAMVQLLALLAWDPAAYGKLA